MTAKEKNRERRKGANAERRAILAKVRREIRKLGYLNSKELLEWLLSRVARYSKRAGGLCVAIALFLPSMSNAGLWDDIGGTVKDFFANNPTNSWDVWMYGLNNVNTSRPWAADRNIAGGWGGGVGISYNVKPFADVSLQSWYCDSTWTLASVNLTFKGTIKLNKDGTSFVQPYAGAGPGWNIQTGQNGIENTVVAVASGGAVIRWAWLRDWSKCDLFGDYTVVTPLPETQKLVRFGVKLSF